MVVCDAGRTEKAIEAGEIVDALKHYGVTQAEVASVTHVSDRAVRGWRQSTARPENVDRLAEMRDLVVLLSDSLTPRGAA